MPDRENTLLDAPQPGLRNNAELYGQAGLATYVAAQIFGNTSLPRESPDWMKVAVESQANFAQRLPGMDAMTIGGAGGGPLDLKAKQEREEEADAEAVDSLRHVAEQLDHEREIERQHETQWLSESHSYAGQTMTGTEWHDMMTWFGNAANVAGWEEAMMAETGESLEEVRRTGGKMKRFYDLMDKDAKGTLTKEEQAEFTKLQQDDKVKRGVEVQQEIEASQHGTGLTTQYDESIDGEQRVSAVTRSDIFQDDAAGPLMRVAPLSAAYADALQRANTTAPPKPVAPVAANTITVSPDHMFG